MKVAKVNKDGKVYYELHQGNKFFRHIGKSRDEYDAFIKDVKELVGILRQRRGLPELVRKRQVCQNRTTHLECH